MLNDTDIRGLDNFLARQSSDDAAPLVSDGTLIGEWKVVGFLGRGGTSEVYRVVRDDTQGMRATARGLTCPNWTSRTTAGGITSSAAAPRRA